MPIIETSTTIAASPHAVAEVFFNFSNFPRWNPFILTLSPSAETLAPGTMLDALFLIGRASTPLRARPVVVRYARSHEGFELVWQGHIVHRLLLGTEHRFVCLPGSDETSVFVQTEKFGGLFGWLFTMVSGGAVRMAFNRMNEQLKAQVEKRGEAPALSSV